MRAVTPLAGRFMGQQVNVAQSGCGASSLRGRFHAFRASRLCEQLARLAQAPFTRLGRGFWRLDGKAAFTQRQSRWLGFGPRG